MKTGFEDYSTEALCKKHGRIQHALELVIRMNHQAGGRVLYSIKGKRKSAISKAWAYTVANRKLELLGTLIRIEIWKRFK